MIYGIKLIFWKYYWNNARTVWLERKNKYKGKIFIRIIDAIYVIFSIILIFYSWFLGLLLLALAIIGTILIFPIIKKNEKPSKKAFFIFLIDVVLTIFILIKVII